MFDAFLVLAAEGPMIGTAEEKQRRVAAPVQALVDLLDESFDRRSWHGTNLRGSVRGLPPLR